MPVIIIGAGIAGLTVARDLSQRRIACVVLEAQNRLGGRVYTKNGLDFGASWLHDVDDNVFFPVAKDQQLDLAYDQNLWFYDQDEVVSQQVVDEAIAHLQTCANAPLPQSLREFATEVSKNYSEKQGRQLRGVMQLMEHWAGMSWHEMPARYSEPHINGRDAFNISGNSKLVDWIVSKIDFRYVKIVRLAPVRQIACPSGGRYLVTTEDNQQFSGPAVVCTIAVGAMKSPNLFDLPLPAPLRRSIAEAPMAALGKVFLTFSSRWWDDRPDRMEVFGKNLDLNVGSAIQPGDLPVFFTNVHKFTRKPILVALTASPLTETIEANPSAAFWWLKPSLAVLRVDKSQDVPDPVDVQVTDWTLNRFFRGSYSGISINQNETEIYYPFSVGHEGLRFAGEHATDDAVGTMHAAYVSGQREAGRVAQICGEKRESRM